MKKTTEFEYRLDNRTILGITASFYVDIDNNEVVSTDRFEVDYISVGISDEWIYREEDDVDNQLILLVEEYINTDAGYVYEVLDVLRGIEVDYKFYWSRLK